MTLEDVGRGGGKEVGRMLEGCCKDVGVMFEDLIGISIFLLF